MSTGDVGDLERWGETSPALSCLASSVVVHREASRLLFPVCILRDGDAEQLRPNLNEDQGFRE